MGANFNILTQKYANQFECIADRCEDDCCGRWAVPVYAADESRLLAALGKEELETYLDRTTNAVGAPATLKKMEDGRCCQQEKSGLCRIQAKHGQGPLPDICADYPRRLVQVDSRLEVTAHLSCPEVSRLALFSYDSLVLEDGDISLIPRPKPDERISTTRSTYERSINDIRSFLLQLLTLPPYTLKERLLMMVFFANSTTSFFHKQATGDVEKQLLEEMEKYSNPAFRKELIAAFAEQEIPSHLALPLIEKVLHVSTGFRKRQTFTELILKAVSTYFDEGETERPTNEMWAMYLEREARMMERFGPELELIFGNFASHFIMHIAYTTSTNLLSYCVLLLIQMAVQKFLLISYPGADEDLESLQKAAVLVVYRCQRTFLHTQILPHIFQDLKQNGFTGDAGAVFLTKF